MSFDERYQVASFRGVEFRVSSNSKTGGNINQHSVFIGKTLPNNSTSTIISQNTRTFSVSAYFAHTDHDLQRAMLETALDDPCLLYTSPSPRDS